VEAWVVVDEGVRLHHGGKMGGRLRKHSCIFCNGESRIVGGSVSGFCFVRLGLLGFRSFYCVS